MSNYRRSNHRRSNYRRSNSRRSKFRRNNCRRSKFRRSFCRGVIVAFIGAIVAGAYVGHSEILSLQQPYINTTSKVSSPLKNPIKSSSITNHSS